MIDPKLDVAMVACVYKHPYGGTGINISENNLTPGVYKLYTEPCVTYLQDEIDRATLYATELAISLHRKLYADVTQWEPLPDLYGLLSQIDNMMCGIHCDK